MPLSSRSGNLTALAPAASREESGTRRRAGLGIQVADSPKGHASPAFSHLPSLIHRATMLRQVVAVRGFWHMSGRSRRCTVSRLSKLVRKALHRLPPPSPEPLPFQEELSPSDAFRGTSHCRRRSWVRLCRLWTACRSATALARSLSNDCMRSAVIARTLTSWIAGRISD